MAGPPKSPKSPEFTAVAPKRVTFLPSLGKYTLAGESGPKLPVRVNCFEVLAAAELEAWDWYRDFVDKKFTFLGRSLTNGAHSILAKHLRSIEAGLVAGTATPVPVDHEDHDEDDQAPDDHEHDHQDDHDEDAHPPEQDTKMHTSTPFEVGTDFGLAGAPDHRNGILHRGARKKPTGANLSLHLFGLAIDVDYDFNMYPKDQGRTALNNILAQARLLFEPALEPQPAPDLPWGWPKKGKKFKSLKYADVVQINTKVKAYIDLIDDDVALQALLTAATAAPWKDASLEDAKAVVEKDFHDAFSVIRSGNTKAKQQAVYDIARESGIMTLTQELHDGIGLSWGGSYGDTMHFDARNLKGHPKTIRAAIKAYKKNTARHEELAEIWSEFESLCKGKDKDTGKKLPTPETLDTMTTKFLEQYPKP